MNFFKIKKSASGETLIEVLIATSVLILILAPASTLYISSIRNNAANKNDLIAASLAEEGIEVLRAMRDTNFLRFAPKAEACWDTKPDENIDLDKCDTAGAKIAAGFYRLSLEPSTLKWSLDSQTADISADVYRLKLDFPGTHLYNYTIGKDTPFYRRINITSENLDGESGADAMKVVSVVQYKLGGKTREISRAAVLFKTKP